MRRALAILCLCGWAVPSTAQDLDPVIRSTRWRLSAERVEDGGQEAYLVGAHFDLLDPLRALPGAYIGFGGFAAVEGDLGGFMSGGATFGFLRGLGRGFSLDTGVFAGLGGGGRLDFDGFVYRPHVALQQEIGPVDLRLELAYFDAPDADFEDLYVSVGITLPSELLLARESESRRKDIPEDAVREHEMRVTPTWLHFEPDSDAERRSGGGSIGDVEMLGQAFDYFATQHLFLAAEIYGATGGDVPGFVLALTGVGVSLPLMGPRLRVEAKGLVGAGGGGDVDTGGGFAWQGMGGLTLDLYGGFALRAMFGHTSFPDGQFDATTTALGLTWSVPSAEIAWDHPRSELAGERLPDDVFHIAETRVEVLHKSHFPSSSARELDGSSLDDFHLVGLGIEHPVFGDFSMTVRGYGGYGDAGGYAEGLLGLRYERLLSRQSPHAFSVHGEAGAAGGGDVDVGSGLIYGASLGYRYRINDHLHVLADYGFTKADTGPFESDFVQLGVGWSMSRPAYR